ncbi:MAG: NAD(P)H-dependent oxidoreductase subunit E [archaeon]
MGKKEAESDIIILNLLNEMQEKHGYLSQSVLKRISEEQCIPIARLYGVAKFYTMLRTEPVGKYVIELCGSPSCVLNSSGEIEKFIEKKLGISIGQTTKDKMFTVYKTSCIGCCDESPAMLVNGKPHTNLTLEITKRLISELKKNANTKRN